MSDEIIEFLRKKDFRFIKELGSGACGKTVLLYDDIINEQFVCKKYAPYYEQDKELLFKNFIQEIKLLHLIYHRNIVRVFNYYIYPEHLTGYILMEYIKGYDIEEYLGQHPENINEVFLQTIQGFSYLESNNILHRDIRPQNLMVTEDGVVKIIDFGFGKQIFGTKDFDKSISLNWWCEPPSEFAIEVYDFTTEVYFVGKLFEKVLREKDIEQFKYASVLNGMCNLSPDKRLKLFSDIKKGILSEKFQGIEFSKNELKTYRDFSSCLFSIVSKIERNSKYFDDIEKIQARIEDLHKRVMLEEHLPNNSSLIQCFVNGSYYFSNENTFSVTLIKSFIDLLRSCSKEKRNIIFSNLHSKLDAVERYDLKAEDDIPF
ncbi:MAG: serine/threonine-protein kinase [Sedimentisphaerales bacterium]